MRTHVAEILSNLCRMGHTIRYVNGKIYSPPWVNADLGLTDNRRKTSSWFWISGFLANSPLKGEAWLSLNLLKEIRIFFTALATVLRHRPELIYRRHNHFNSDYLIARLFNIPSIKEVNAIGTDELAISKRVDRLTIWLYKIIESFNMTRAEQILVVTQELKETLQSRYGVDPNKITVIQNGANIDLFKPMDIIKVRQELGLNQAGDYICFVGLLERWQGLQYLIKSLPLILNRCPETWLLIVGDGRIKDEISTLIEQTGIKSRVITTGIVPYEKVPLYINASDVCVAPFIKDVNKKGGLCSLKMHEYLACGKPCVISRLRGLEVMEKHHCLIMVEPENVPELAMAITGLLNDKNLRNRMGNNGRRYIVENQSWESVAKRVAEVCHSLVESRRNGASRNVFEKEKSGPDGEF